MMETKRIQLNKYYYIKMMKNEKIGFCYLFKETKKSFERVCESGNVYSFIEKAKKFTRLSKKVEEETLDFMN